MNVMGEDGRRGRRWRGLVPGGVARVRYVGGWMAAGDGGEDSFAGGGGPASSFARVCSAVRWFGRASGGWGWDEAVEALVGVLVAHAEEERDAFHLAVGLLGSPVLAGRFSEDASVREARKERDRRVLMLALAGTGEEGKSGAGVGGEAVETVLEWVPSLFARSSLPWVTVLRCLDRALEQSASWHTRGPGIERRRMENGALHVAYAVLVDVGGPVQAASALDPDAFMEAVRRAEGTFEANMIDRLVAENQGVPALCSRIDARLLADELEALRLKDGVLTRALHAAQAEGRALERDLAAAEFRAREEAALARRVEAAEEGAKILAGSLQRSEEERSMLHAAVYKLQREIACLRRAAGAEYEVGDDEGGFALDPWLAPSAVFGDSPVPESEPQPVVESSVRVEHVAEPRAQTPPSKGSGHRKKGGRRSMWRRHPPK